MSLGKLVYPSSVTVLCRANQSNFFIRRTMLSLLNSLSLQIDFQTSISNGQLFLSHFATLQISKLCERRRIFLQVVLKFLQSQFSLLNFIKENISFTFLSNQLHFRILNLTQKTLLINNFLLFQILINIFINPIMSGKREASYTIDPNTLEEKEKDQDSPLQQDIVGDKLQKEQRKIFKIKRPGQGNGLEHKETKVAFKLNQSQQIKPSTDDPNGAEDIKKLEQKEAINPFNNLFKADKNIFNGIGIFSNPKSTNIFTSNQGTEQTSKTQANSIIAPSIFSVNPTNGKNLFDNSNSSLKNTSASLFTRNTPVNEDDGSGDSAQLQQAQKIESDPSKSEKTYNYDDSCPVLLSLKASKFKKTGSDLIENVQIVLQKQKQTSIKYLTVKLPVTKKSIFSGLLIEGRSEVRHLHGKKQNVQVSVFYKQKGSFSRILLKFQFERQEDGEKLFERLDEMLCAKKQLCSDMAKDKTQ